MKAYLRAYNLWSAVKKCYEPLAESGNLTVAQIKQQKEESTRNYKALSFLHSTVAATIFPRIVGASTAKEAWDTLQEEFQGSDSVRAIKLLNFRREFELLKMKDGDAVKDYVSKLIETVNQMRIIGEKIPHQNIIEKVLISLPERFDSKVAAIEESKDLAKLTVNELIGSLQAHEQRISKRVESSTE
ncbi:UBN2 domain-containing protein [Cephalotus follicularis]|uniref:UBN2 domain-containing protein n=1 Tax=Cephalotus follicularis TaxID=3775 RepID=A0A1Q3CKG4_CEPFO|nr:UBN2 domain-containing protein [Cephalotus follicularis]